MPITIEKDIPLPLSLQNRVKVGYLPIAELELGDSFFVEMSQSEIDRALHSIRVRLTRYGSMNRDKKFSSSKAPDGSGIRVWRTK